MHGNMRLLDESTVKAVSGIAVGEDEIVAAGGDCQAQPVAGKEGV